MKPQSPVVSQEAASAERVARAMRDLDDGHLIESIVAEVTRRGSLRSAAGQVERALQMAQTRVRSGYTQPTREAVRGMASAAAMNRRAMIARTTPASALQVPHACSAEAAEILVRRGVLPDSSPVDALRRFAREGRLIVLRGDRRWVYPRFQLDHFDPRQPDNIVAVVNRLLEAGRSPEIATAWWTTRREGAEPGQAAPVDLLGRDHSTLRELATAYVLTAQG